MASFWSLLGILLMAFAASSSASHQLHHLISTISAAPSSLPPAPLSSSPVTIPAAPATQPGPPEPRSPSPALSPDISPLFPSPKGEAATPAESSLPIIPSSPSPPNPDDREAAASGPVTTPVAPSGAEPVTATSDSVRVEALMVPSLILCSLAVYSMQLIGM